MPLKTNRWDAVKYLGSEEQIVNYLSAVFEEGDPAAIAAALEDAARARGLQEIVRNKNDTANPTLETVGSILKSLNLKLTVVSG